MKYFLIFLFFFIGVSYTAHADHITGGEMFYTYLGTTNGMHQYQVTAKLFMRCNSGRQFNNPATFTVFDKANGNRVQDISVNLSRQENISLTNANKCITDPPPVCYEVGYYEFNISVPASSSGYVIAVQVYFRINTITNFTLGYRQVGATYTAEIPGQTANALKNHSARFVGSDLVVVCANNSFSYSFAAQDNDGDELRYSFCEAYQASPSGGGGNNNVPPSTPPYTSVPYGSGFTGNGPLGGNVRINPQTGLITGIAPASGTYVVTVCVEEIRNGVTIATQRKDLQINITSCTIAAASLLPDYMVCKDSKTLTVTNQSTSPLINTYSWELTTWSGELLYNTTTPTVSYTFPDTGLYKVKLAINKGQECSDSSSAVVRVYPGFKPDFTASGVCLSKPTQFKDATTTVYGRVKSWAWDLGESRALDDVSSRPNTEYTYPYVGDKKAQLIVTNTNGCIDTVEKYVTVVEKPPMALKFRDTLICINDKVQLQANGEGNFSWTPAAAITAAHSATPVVSPAATTTYFVRLDDNGCINNDSVRVRVTDRVRLQVMKDTTICGGDSIRLRIASDAFAYSWTPAAQLSNSSVPDPVAVTPATTPYEVTATIGSCTAKAKVTVTTVPYPTANAGADTLMCYNGAIQLNGSMQGSSLSWTPAATLSGATILDPVARPKSTTAYTLTVRDTKGCPKPGRDTVLVTVLPKIVASAGSDTSVIAGQPLQLEAIGGIRYTWLPTTGLSATDIPDPIAILNSSTGAMRYKVLVYDEGSCVDSAYINIKVFEGPPTVYVPTAFTPNRDGLNDLLRPIAAGIQKIDYFHIFNRWGRIVFSTTSVRQGWDGTINGQAQATGVYVWVLKAVDYNGKVINQRGSTTLIR